MGKKNLKSVLVESKQKRKKLRFLMEDFPMGRKTRGRRTLHFDLHKWRKNWTSLKWCFSILFLRAPRAICLIKSKKSYWKWSNLPKFKVFSVAKRILIETLSNFSNQRISRSEMPWYHSLFPPPPLRPSPPSSPRSFNLFPFPFPFPIPNLAFPQVFPVFLLPFFLPSFVVLREK